MYAKDLMQVQKLWACSESSDCRHVAQMMLEHNVGSIPVLDEQGRLEGIVTDRDICCRIVAEGKSYETPVREVMTPQVRTCRPDTSLKEVESVMKEYRIRRLPVVDEESRLQGFISLADLARECHGLIQEHRLAEVLESVSAAS